MDVRRAVFVGVALLFAGCVNLQGATLSNIGNGNSANISGNNLSGSVNVGQGSSNPTSSPSNYNPGKVTQLTLNRSDYHLIKAPSDLNLDNLRYYSSRNLLTDQDLYNGGAIAPSGDAPYFGNLEEIRFNANVKREYGQNEDVDPNNGDWIFELPPGTRIVNPQTPEGWNGQFPRFLLASSEAVAGSYVLTLRSKWEPNVVATASVVIDEKGVADVEVN